MVEEEREGEETAEGEEANGFNFRGVRMEKGDDPPRGVFLPEEELVKMESKDEEEVEAEAADDVAEEEEEEEEEEVEEEEEEEEEDGTK